MFLVILLTFLGLSFLHPMHLFGPSCIHGSAVQFQVLALRMKGAMTGDGGNFDWNDLFYLSIHTLDAKSGLQYARMRVNRELLDAWLEKKVSFQGNKFSEEEVFLTDKDQFVVNIASLRLAKLIQIETKFTTQSSARFHSRPSLKGLSLRWPSGPASHHFLLA